MAQEKKVKIYLIGHLVGDVDCKNFQISDYLSKFKLKKIDNSWFYTSKKVSLHYELAEKNVAKLADSPWIEGLNNTRMRTTLNMWDAKYYPIKAALKDTCGFPIGGLDKLSTSSIWVSFSVSLFTIEPELEGDTCLDVIYLIGLLGFEIINDNGNFRIRNTA